MNHNKLRVLAIAGSLRRESCNRRLLEWAAAHAPSRLDIEIHDGLEGIPLFNEDHENPEPLAVARLRDKVEASHGVLIATPEYNQSLPGVLKNVIDWLSRPPREVLVKRPVAVMGATMGRWGTRLAQSHLRHILQASEALVMPQPCVFIGGASTLFDANGEITDAGTADAVVQMLVAFEDWMRTSR